MTVRLTVCLLLLPFGAAAQDGRQVFAEHCQVCHGDGRGTERGPNLVNNPKVRRQSIDELRTLIRDGMPGMPPSDLPPAELGAVTGYVRSLSAPAVDAPVEGDRAAGEQFFFGKGGCAGCHMSFGRGKAVGPDLSSVARTRTVEEIRQAVLHPSDEIKPGYQVVNVRLADGSKLRGFARSQNRYNLQLQDLQGQFHMLAADEFTLVNKEGTSLMPEAACKPDECRGLVAYLSSLGGVTLSSDIHPFASSGGPTFDDILHPNPDDWLTYHGSISGDRHSRLDQINTSNVKDLKLEWIFPIDHPMLQLTPLVVDEVMYITGPNQVFALDARAGRTIWHYQRPETEGGGQGKGTNRGVAVLGDRVYTVTNDVHLVALHRLTGEPLWEADIIEGLDKKNYGSTSAPLVVKDMVVAGVSGGDIGVRGFLSAFKADTGKRVWRVFTVPKPGEPGSETWQGTALTEYGGGGATWMTGTYDPETDTIFWGTGNPYPSMNGDERMGDNLYTDAVLALDPGTGELKWYYQFTPHDLYDWDGGQTSMVLNTRYRGRNRQLLVQANRNGFLYVFDRTNGELLLAEKLVDKVTWATAIGDDGRPILVPGTEPTRDGTKVCPNVLGAANWPSVAFNPVTNLFYVNTREACGIYSKPPRWNRKPIPLE